MFNLRKLCVVPCGFLSTLLMINPTFAGMAEHITVVDDGVYAYGDPAGGYTSMFVVTDDGVIVLEPINTKHSTAMLEAIRSVTDQPIRYLLHSHNHWDHSGGGQVFRDAGETIVAHVEAYAWMKANPHKDMALPDEVWAGNREFIEDLKAAIYAEFAKGSNPFTIPDVVKLPKYKDWAMYDKWLPMNAWRLLLDDHMGPFPWRPNHSYEAGTQ